MRQVRPGARIAMAGIKFFPWWTGPLNLLAWAKNRPYNARPADLWQPWSLVAAWCDGFHWTSTQWGMGYIASGTRKATRHRRDGTKRRCGSPSTALPPDPRRLPPCPFPAAVS